MLTCVSRSKQRDDYDESKRNNKQSAKKIGSQIKDIAVKASGAYRSCNPCTTPAMAISQQQQLQKRKETESDLSASVLERFRMSYHRSGSKNSSSGSVWGKEMEARLKSISIGSGGGGDMTPGTFSGSASRRIEPVVLVDEIEPKEWVAQVEPGVLITFISLPRGGNDLKQIRFSREMFNKWQAQRWWQENFDKVMELYNVQRLSRQAFPLPTPPKSEDELDLDSGISKIEKLESIGDGPLTPSLSIEKLPHTLQPDHSGSTMMPPNRDSSGLTVSSKVSHTSGSKTNSSSIDASISASSSKEADQSREPSVSIVSDSDNEWVEEDEPGVYLSIRALPDGSRELRRVRFSREKFGEVHARLWWEENRARIHNQYL